MGSAMTFYPEEFPQSRVEVSAFQIGRGPVTNAQFAAFCRASGHVTVAEQGAEPGSLVFVGTPGPVALDEWRQWWRWVPGASWRAPEGPGTTVDERENHPVVHIAYSDALAYARWCGGDLPTEAEWEWAARGGLVGATYAWGEEPNRGERLYANTWQGDFPFDNHGAHGWRGTSPVGEFPPNGYGLADVTGNVWEWTADRYVTYPSGAVTDPTGPASGGWKVTKSGGWDGDQTVTRAALRGAAQTNHKSMNNGFRVALKRVPASSLSTGLVAYYPFDGNADDVFSDRPEELWRTVLARQPGRLSWLADAPDDLSLN